MVFNNNRFPGAAGAPLNKSLFTQFSSEGAIAPGGAKFITTEDSIKITTEDGVFLVTEG